jgi:hypothetical protein
MAPFDQLAISNLIWIKVRSLDPSRVNVPARQKEENDTMADTALLPQRSSIWWIFLLQGFAGIILGLMPVTEPAATVVAPTTFLGFYWLILGLLALVQVFVDRATPWIWSAADSRRRTDHPGVSRPLVFMKFL